MHPPPATVAQSQMPILIIPPHETWPSMNPSSHPGAAAHMTVPMTALSASSKPSTPPRKVLTVEDRRRIARYAKEHPHERQANIGLVFGVDRRYTAQRQSIAHFVVFLLLTWVGSTVSKILKRDLAKGGSDSPGSRGCRRSAIAASDDEIKDAGLGDENGESRTNVVTFTSEGVTYKNTNSQNTMPLVSALMLSGSGPTSTAEEGPFWNSPTQEDAQSAADTLLCFMRSAAIGSFLCDEYLTVARLQLRLCQCQITAASQGMGGLYAGHSEMAPVERKQPRTPD